MPEQGLLFISKFGTGYGFSVLPIYRSRALQSPRAGYTELFGQSMNLAWRYFRKSFGNGPPNFSNRGRWIHFSKFLPLFWREFFRKLYFGTLDFKIAKLSARCGPKRPHAASFFNSIQNLVHWFVLDGN